jgi:uncharacterized protein (DUF342 family)
MEQDAAWKNQAEQLVSFGNEDDGKLSISVSPDNLEARANFIPPLGSGKPLTRDAVAAILSKINIVHGIRWGVIEETLSAYSSGRRLIKDILVAQGEAPKEEIAEYYEMNSALIKKEIDPRSFDQIDYHERSPFTVVKKGQALAKFHPRKPGWEGRGIHGETLPFLVVQPESVTAGSHTQLANGLIISDINGQLIKNGNVLNVQETLVIKGAVGYGTGHIVFPGDVLIEGPVSDGFKIYTGGSLTIKQTFDVTEVVTKGDLNVAGGIIGRGAALIKSGGAIKTKFIENSHAAARKIITVDNEIINSSVFTLEHIEMGDHGLILGSDIYAVHGVRAAGIGRKSGKTTRIHCGIDFTAQQEKERCNNRLRILSAKLARLKELASVSNLDDGRAAAMEELRIRLEGEQRQIQERISALLSAINADENAVVEVSGEVAAGTLIEICQLALFVSEPLRKVRIRLDKATGRLVNAPL